jgi:tight adherence protein B
MSLLDLSRRTGVMHRLDAKGAAGVVVAAAVLAAAASARAGVRATRAAAVARRVPTTGAHATRPAPPWLAGAIADAGLTVDAATVWRWLPLAAAAVVVAGLTLGGPVFALLLTGGGLIGARLWLRSRRGQAAARLDRALPVALEAVARSLRSGASLGQAIAEAAEAAPPPLAAELARVVAEAGAGAGLVAALERLGERNPSGAVRLAVAAMALGVDTGGAQAKAVDGVAATLRDRLAIGAEVRALSSQARASAVVIGIAPVAFGAVAVTADRGTAAFLFRTPVGLACLTTGLGLDALSWLWMRRLVRFAP